VAALNHENRRSSKGKEFNVSMIRWIRYRHKIPSAALNHPQGLSVQQVAQRFGVSIHVVYYWIERRVIEGSRLNAGSPYWITLGPEKEQELLAWVQRSSRIRNDSRGHSETVL
jgi:transposase